MPHTNHSKLEEAIRKACPELMELSFGCEVEIGAQTGRVVSTLFEPDIMVLLEEDVVTVKEYKILGHPIELQHILRTIAKEEKSSVGSFYIDLNGILFLNTTSVGWDLSQPLSGQSESTKVWLETIILGE